MSHKTEAIVGASTEDDVLQIADKEVIDQASWEWGRVMDMWRAMYRLEVTAELARAGNIFRSDPNLKPEERERIRVVTTVGTPEPEAMEVIAKSDRNKLPALRDAVFMPTIGPVQLSQEVRYKPEILEDSVTQETFEGYEAIRVELREGPDDPSAISAVVSCMKKSARDVRETQRHADLLSAATIQQEPLIVRDIVKKLVRIYRPGSRPQLREVEPQEYPLAEAR